MLRLPPTKDVQIIGYADDFAVTIVANDLYPNSEYGNDAIAKIKDWLITCRLQLAGERTEVVLITIKLNVIRVACAFTTVSVICSWI